jgi:HSP20 family molecular chaperone IbpA
MLPSTGLCMPLLNLGYLIVLMGISATVVGLTVRVVPFSQQWVVERFGRTVRVLKPGWNVVVPFMDRIRHKVNMTQHLVEIKDGEFVTEDNVSLSLDLTAFLLVHDPVKASYGVSDLPRAIEVLVRTNLRSAIRAMTVEDLLGNAQRVEDNMRSILNEGAAFWGATISALQFGHIRRSWPVYKVERTDAMTKLLTLVVPGFLDSELSVELEGSRLIVRGNKHGDPARTGPGGAATILENRSFERRFQLGDHVEIKNARLAHGILEIEIARRVPESALPRLRIGISGNLTDGPDSKVIRAA